MDFILSSFSSTDLSSDEGGYGDGDDQTRRRRSTREEREEIRKQLHAQLEAEIASLTEQIENAKTELSCRKDIRQKLKSDHAALVEESTERRLNLKQMIDKALMPGDVSRRSSLDSLYIGTMRNIAGPGSMYVQQIQGQVCRSLHMAAVHKKMRDLMNKQAQQFVSFMKMQVDQQKIEAAESTQAYESRTLEVTSQMRFCSENNEPKINFQHDIILKLKEHEDQMTLENPFASNAISEEATMPPRRQVRRASLSSLTFLVNSRNEFMSNSEGSSNDRPTFVNARPARRSSLSSSEFIMKGSSTERPPLGAHQKSREEAEKNDTVQRMGRQKKPRRRSDDSKTGTHFSRSMSPILTAKFRAIESGLDQTAKI